MTSLMDILNKNHINLISIIYLIIQIYLYNNYDDIYLNIVFISYIMILMII